MIWRSNRSTTGGKYSFRSPTPHSVTSVTHFWFGEVAVEHVGAIRHVRYLTIEALASALHEYIGWYNTERTSTWFGGLSPVQYRTQTLTASAFT